MKRKRYGLPTIQYGLADGVWPGDEERAVKFARRVREAVNNELFIEEEYMRKFLKTVFGRGDRLESIPASSQKSQKQPVRPPSKAQVEKCEWLGLEIKPGMSSRDVWLMVNDAKNDPRIKELDDAYLAQQWAAQEAEDREEYGDVVVDNYKRIQELCQAGVHHIVVFKTGKKVDADVLEFESVTMDKNEKEIIVTVEACRPKIHKPRGESPRIDWKKEIAIRLDQILEIDTLPTGIDQFDLDGFEKARIRANQLKQKYLQG
jgi:hypothetical protein